MRLIDADALKYKNVAEVNGILTHILTAEEIDNAPTVDTTCPHCDSGYAQGYSDGYLRGKEERPQGEWIIDQEGDKHSCTLVTCPFCGERHCCKMNFCGNCGADMRGAE